MLTRIGDRKKENFVRRKRAQEEKKVLRSVVSTPVESVVYQGNM